MGGELSCQIMESARTALIDGSHESNDEFRPRLVFNDNERFESVLSVLEKELADAEEFCFSVAFINEEGLTMLLSSLENARKRNLRCRLITTDYLDFNTPKVFRKLLSLNFIEVRIITGKDHFHTKGYYFKNHEKSTILIGSSNLTAGALKTNKEWNIRTTSLKDGALTKDFETEFEWLWSQASILTASWITEYEKRYDRIARISRDSGSASSNVSEPLEPNKMQIEAMAALEALRNNGKNKALLIAATGTGKTYLAAFDIYARNPDHMLFLVHRGEIMRQAADDFQKILGRDISGSIGFLTGDEKNFSPCKYLFSTVQTMSKCEVYSKFPPEYFDYIIIDEVHKAGAASYKRLIGYFRPGFLLGMSATPDRPDKENIYELFDYNIACDIRLKEAMGYGLVCPFHYFGVSDIQVDGVSLDEYSDFNHLTLSERVDRIIEKAKYFGHYGKRVQGLVFCSRREEARVLSMKFNERGFRTAAISDGTSVAERRNLISRLEQEEYEGGLDYIFTVDLLNEGVSIKPINQIIMLRPTKSNIIFLQQLGRGLRCLGDKFLVVIDFIGNYEQNFLIPITLSGDNSLDKDVARKMVSQGSRLLPGTSTIQFDEIAKQKIYNSIDKANMLKSGVLRDSYFALKSRLGRIPHLMDFEANNTVDAYKYIEKYNSYYSFLVKYEPEYTVRLSKNEVQTVDFVSKFISNGKRLSELIMLKNAIARDGGDLLEHTKMDLSRYSVTLSDFDMVSTVGYLENRFHAKDGRFCNDACVFIVKDDTGRYTVSEAFGKMLDHVEYRTVLTEIIDYGIHRYETFYGKRYKDTNFTLYEKYTYEDVCKLLNFESMLNAQIISGYFYDKRTKTLPVFINYEKDEGSIKYEDRFEDEKHLIALSKKPRKIDSPDADHIFKRTNEDRDNKIYLFVRKNKDDIRKEFYFLGGIEATGNPCPVILADGNSAFEIRYELDVPVRPDIYDYLIAD